MTRDEWVRVKRIVAGALSHTGAERSAFVEAECGSQDAVRAEVDSLLAAAVHAADFYDEPTLLIHGARVKVDAFDNLTPISVTSLRQAVSTPDTSTPETHFQGTARFVVRRQIGVGGMGIVYEVEDRTRNQIVALKTLLRWDATDIYRLKREFRTLADIAHSNLVSLYELVVDEALCFFTMEFVNGTTFVDYIRGSHGAAPDIDRVRRTLPQLIEGLQELHRRGIVHRDVKPSNVMVTEQGRLVILDFGLTSNLSQEEGTFERGLAGTPAYLAPEQCLGLQATEMADWYSVGATLYHALTGRAPFDGNFVELIQRKTTSDPAPASTAAVGVPDDLDAVCMALLCRDPERRLSGPDALGRLSRSRSAVIRSAEPFPEAPFVGREYYLDVLSAAFAAVKEGRSASVYIHGPSGIGKSALVQSFFDRRLSGEPLVALRSRCHAHESVPYKGLDGLIDSLSRYLNSLPGDVTPELIPNDAHALARLFPVMQIESVVAAAAAEQEVADPVALRSRAFAALRELLKRVAKRQPLVLEIDDFQWADLDSAVSLTELLRPPDAPAILLLVSFRSEEIDAKPFLRSLIDRVDLGTRIVLPLAPLTDGEVAALMAALLPTDTCVDSAEGLAIAREAAGNPFLVEELTRYAALGAGAARGATLEEMLNRRLDALPPESRGFLETLAVCGRPILPERLYEACGLTGDERPLVARLRSAHFLRSSRSGEHVEMYHDRIREALVADVPHDVARRMHELMAQILVAHGDDDPEALFDHYHAAGHDALAATHAAAAAIRAGTVLAFDRAAGFYRHALTLQPRSDRRAEWTAGLATALENAGRPAEAADAYLQAAQDAHDVQRVEGLRQAAEQLLIGGHIDRGLEIIDTVLHSVGMRLARGPRTALASILLRRAQLGWRGLDFVAKDEARIAPADLLRIDTCWSITTGLAMVDNIRAAAFHVRQLLIALDTGEPYRVARALALEAAFSAIGGGKAGQQRSAAFSERARAMAEQVGHPHAIALSLLSTGVAAFLLGQWARATEIIERALTILRDECRGVIWEMNLAHDFFLGSLLFRGEIRDVSHWLPGLLEATRSHGNLYFETELRTRMNLVWLAADDPDGGERQANDAIGRWSDSGFHRQHYNHFLARVQTALYRGRAREAWKLVVDHRAPLQRNLWLRVQFIRIETAFQRARCALAMAGAGLEVRRMRAIAEREARQIAREDMPWSNPLALQVQGTLAYLAGDHRAAISRLTRAVEAFTEADMKLYAAAASRRLAVLVGGDRGRAMQRDADAWMAAQEIRNPSAMTRLFAPGFRD